MLTTATKTKGVLFVISEEDRKENGPTLSGNVSFGKDDKTGKETTIGLSAFLQMSEETGRQYYNLSLGDKDDTHFYGRLFRNEDKKGPKSPDYTGFFTILPVTKASEKRTDEEWEEAPKLTVFGRRVRNADNSVRVDLNILPMRSQEPVGDDELPL